MSGIPENIPQDELGDKVLEIINTIKERSEDSIIPANDIHACHRLKKVEGEGRGANPKVIRMVNTVDILRSKKRLKGKAVDFRFQNLFINENLCPENKTIHNLARQLKEKCLLNACWTYNGGVNINISENSRPKKIFHMSYYGSFFLITNNLTGIETIFYTFYLINQILIRSILSKKRFPNYWF